MKIQISDKINGTLSLDLNDILDIIGTEESKSYSWQVFYLERIGDFTGKHELIKLVESLNVLRVDESIEISFDLLKLLAENTVQIIDTRIIGRRMSDYVELEAVDSSFWEIESNNNELLNNFINRFKEVKIVD